MVANPVHRLGRKQCGAILLVVLVAFAGCSGIGSQSGSNGATTTSKATTSNATNSGSNASGGNATGNATGGNTTGSSTGGGNASSKTLNGSMTVVLGSKPVNLTGGSGSVTFGKGDRGWNASDGITISQALRTQGIDLTKNHLSANGASYDATENGTYVQVRVNGKPVDPTTYTLKDGDQVWVAASKPDTNFNPPGTFIPESSQHIHGHMSVTIDGHAVDFSKSRFQEQNHYFHYEDGEGSHWHDHSWDVTLAYAMKTLGFDVTRHTVTYNGTTYRNSDSGTTVKVLVNGHPVDPEHYRLMDGDNVTVVVKQDNS